MSSTAQLDSEWELPVVKGWATSPLLSDDDLDTFSPSLSQTPSELGDEAWEGVYDDNISDRSTSISPFITPSIDHTPLQTARKLIDDDSTLISSNTHESSMSNSESAFSYRWPDPLSTSSLEEETNLPLDHSSDDSDIELSDMDTCSVIDLVGSIDELERSSTLVLPKKPTTTPTTRSPAYYAT